MIVDSASENRIILLFCWSLSWFVSTVMLLFVGVEFLFAGWWFVSALAGGGVAEMFWVFCGCWFNAEGGGDIVGMSGVSAGVGWSGCGVLQLGWRLVVGSKAVVMWLVG